MDEKKFVEGLLPLLGGQQNISRQSRKDTVFSFTVKDSGAVRLEALRQTEGVAAAELSRGRVKVTAKENFVEDITMATDNNKRIAEDVLAAVGGKDNITNVTHCMTRLRFNFKDDKIVDQNKIKNIEGVAGIMVSGGQFQVIIGQNVPKVYSELCQMGGFQTQKAIDENLDAPKKKLTPKSVFSEILNYMAGSLTPLIPVMMAGAMSKTVLALFGSTFLGLIADGSNLAILFDFVYDASFYFYPIYLGYTAAKKLNTSIPIGLFLGGIMLAPDFMALVGAETPFTVFGIPCTVNDYSSSVVPILLSVWAMSYVYRFFDKYVPSALSTVFTPFLTVLVMLPIMLCFLAPLGSILGGYLAVGMEWLGAHCGFLAVAVIGAIYQILVMTGMHSTIVVLCITNLFSTGSESLLFVGAATAITSCAGIALGSLLRLKSKSERSLCTGYFASVMLSGVTEPTLYGLCVKYKRPFIALVVSGFVGGLYAGTMHVTYHALISPLVLAPFSYTAGGTANMIHGTISIVIAFVLSTIITYFFGFTKEDLEADRARAEKEAAK